MTTPQKPVVFILGPTASGKTSAAMSCAMRFPVELISIDSTLVYRGMNIGTAKPTSDELKRFPHALIDICDPWDIYSAAQFRTDALAAIEAAYAKNKMPVLVGGTMLYAKVLLHGLSAAPSSDPRIKLALQQQLLEKGSVFLHGQLKHIDPLAAERIHPHDPQRILRALEVYQTTHIPLSTWWQQQDPIFPYKAITLILAPHDRQILHQRIEVRFKQMLAQGFIDEVIEIMKFPMMHKNLPSMRAVGYRQILDYLNGEYDYEMMVDKAVAASRQLAKRQLTWLRAWPNAKWFEIADRAFWETIYNLFQ